MQVLHNNREKQAARNNLRLLLAKGVKFSEITKMTFPRGKAAQLRFWADNCEKLARIITSQQAIHFDMGDWGAKSPEHDCGTVGCALGIAAMSGQFDGLQYRIDIRAYVDLKSTNHQNIEPVVNGHTYNWFSAGETFFGRAAYHKVFVGDYTSRRSVARALRECAKEYRALAEAYD